MKTIQLTQGKVALVDDEDSQSLSSRKWFTQRIGRVLYAARHGRLPDGTEFYEYMHRTILSRILDRAVSKVDLCDHVNGDGLDNRRENLRLATKAQNRRNCVRHSSNPSSKYLGVYWRKDTKKWCARVGVKSEGKRRHICLGYFVEEIDAAKARELYINDHPELMARSNF